MRKQTRPPIPEVLEKYGTTWNQQWVQLRTKNPSAMFQWYVCEGKSAREWLLPHLHAMTQGHCAFCDTFPLEDRSTTPIEHFKPKSRVEFHQHAFDWDNLYYCCERCQQTKRERWFEQLLRPDEATYQFEFYFMFDFTTGAIAPNRFALPQDQERARLTIELYGLDSAERRKHRRIELRKYGQSSNQLLEIWAYRDYLELGRSPESQLMENSE